MESKDVIHSINSLTRLDNLGCLTKDVSPNQWAWFWRDECEHTEFDSMDAFNRLETQEAKLGLISVDGKLLHIDLPSFKRACLAAKFFSLVIDKGSAIIHFADFFNKVFKFLQILSFEDIPLEVGYFV